jgi:nucleoside-diphosphate-sugar epimerase
VRGVDLAPEPAAGVVAGDIGRRGGWEAVFAGAELVVHTAALVSNTATRDQAWAVNVIGTRNVLDAARDARVRRVVVFSSAAVYSHHRDGAVTEDTPVRPGDGVYGDSKIAAEHLALLAHAAGGIEVTILRPSEVYGPGSRPWTVLPVRNLRAGRVVLPARGRGVFDPVYVDDVVVAVAAAGEAGAAAGRVVNVGGGAPVTTAEFFGHYCRMLGIGAPRTAPTPVASGLAAVVGRVSRLRGRPSEITPATMRMLAGTGSLSIERGRELLGWEPRVDLDEGMARTEAWLRDQGELG